MNPPMVYEETKPSNHRTIRMTAIVSSMSGTHSRVYLGHKGPRRLEGNPGNGTGSTSLDLHVVLNGGHATDAVCQLNCPVRFSPRAHEATQLDRALEGLDFDLHELRQGVFGYGCFHFGGDDSVVDIFACSLLRGCRRASDSGAQRNGQKNCGKRLVELFHGGTPGGLDGMGWSLRLSKLEPTSQVT